MKYYTIGDRPPEATRQKLRELNGAEILPGGYLRDGSVLRAKPTGEFRPPSEGEWYISGAIPTAYLASNGLSNSRHIARICVVKEENIVHCRELYEL